MSFPRYPAYKDSGVEWLGEVPGHWGVKKIGHVADLIAGFAFPSDRFGFEPEAGIPLVRGDNVTEGWLRWGEKGRYWPHGFEYDVRYLLAPNDILVQMDGSKVGKNWALVGAGDLPALLVQRVTRIRANEALPKLVYSFIANEMFVRYVDRAKTDPAIPHITMKDIADYWITLPPLPEQTQITAFLDRETAKIDELVAEQRRLMALLKEKRLAVISHAVTRGLNPKAAMKDSGVAWLGEVPGHWEVKPLKHVIQSITSGVSVNSTDLPASSDEIGVLKTSCVYTGDFAPLENKTVVPDEYGRVACPVLAGTLIVSRMNTPELVGAAGVVHESYKNLFLPDRLWQVHFENTNPSFVHYWTRTRAYRSQVEMACEGTSSSMQNLAQSDFRNFCFPHPEINEQATIVAYLNHQTTQIDTLILETQTAIILMQERRNALISAAVTGKMDVR